jgi:cysteine desulfurase
MPTTPIYLDHAATTPVRPEALEAMLPFLGSAAFGNPSSSHRFGRAARAGLEQARREVAQALGAEPNQVYFTSGGTEADNLAVIGTALAARTAGRPMLAAVSATEHKAILAAAHAVVHLGGRECILPVDAAGQLELAALVAALGERPSVVSVMWVNNETGVIQDIPRIAALCQAAGTPFHTDMVQAFGRIPLAFDDRAITLATISGHKLGAPKGIGALLVRDPRVLEPIQHGGNQQHALRPGTENVAGAAALGRAALLAAREQSAETRRLTALRDRLAAGLQSLVPGIAVTGAAAPRAPHVLNLLVPGVRSDALLMHLDLAGLAASGGSACSTGAAEASHVLTAMGIPAETGVTALRLSLGRETTDADIDRTLELFPAIAEKVRRLTMTLSDA